MTGYSRWRFVRIVPVCALLATASFGLSACGGGSVDETVQEQDTAYTQAMDSGRDALAIERYAVAERQYREATRLALRRNDRWALGDAAFNLAVTQLAAGQPSDALVTIQNARQALALRANTDAGVASGTLPSSKSDEHTQPDTGSFDLVGAAAYYRLGDMTAAARAASQAEASSLKDVSLRAAFLSGLIASERGDAASLEHAIERLDTAPTPHSAVLRADLDELRARGVMGTAPRNAMGFAADSASLRRSTGEYRAMARALSVEARAARAAGDTAQASALFAQAAQALAARGSDLTNTASGSDGLALRLAGDAGIPVPLQPFSTESQTGDTTKQ